MKFTANVLPATVTLASFMTREADAIYLPGIVRLFRGDGDTPLQDQAKGMHLSYSGDELSYPDETPYGEVSRKVFKFDGYSRPSGSSEGLPSGKEARTMMGWIKSSEIFSDQPSQLSFGYGKTGGGTSEPYLYAIMLMNTGQYELDHFGGGEATGQHNKPVDQWFHVAGTYNGTHGVLYQDGELVGGGPDDRIDTATDSPATLFLGGGWYPNNNQFDGYVADFAIFDRALSAAEIKSVFESKDGLKPELTLEEKYTMTLVPGSVAVAFDENSSKNETSYNLKVAKETVGTLNTITILDFTTCKIPFSNSEIISAKLLGDKQITNADDRYDEVPIEIDVNTKMFGSADSPDDYFTTKVDGKNNAQVKFCVMSELGSTTVVDLADNGNEITSSISYNKLKFNITIDMENNFAVQDMNIEEENASTASKEVVIDYGLTAYECNDNDTEIENPPAKKQNSMVRICIDTPTDNDVVIASIKNFKLKSDSIASNAIKDNVRNALTEVEGEGSKTVAVTTQMVSAFFSDLDPAVTDNTIDIEGTAVMEFKATGTRKLVRISSNNQKNGNVSDMDRKLDGDAGLGEFAMKVGISKSSSEANGAATSGASNALSATPLVTVTSLALGGVLMGTMF